MVRVPFRWVDVAVTAHQFWRKADAEAGELF